MVTGNCHGNSGNRQQWQQAQWQRATVITMVKGTIAKGNSNSKVGLNAPSKCTHVTSMLLLRMVTLPIPVTIVHYRCPLLLLSVANVAQYHCSQLLLVTVAHYCCCLLSLLPVTVARY